jgi:hypothetical protein
MNLLISILATWRLTSLLVYEEGPAAIFAKTRAASKAVNGPLECFWCASVWTAAFVALLSGGRRGWLVRALALSAGAAGAIMLDGVNTRINSP